MHLVRILPALLVLFSGELQLNARPQAADSAAAVSSIEPDTLGMARQISPGDSIAVSPDSILASDSLIVPPDSALAVYDTLTFSVVGDIMVHDAQLEAAWDDACACYSFDSVFYYVTPHLEAADFTIGNLETTLSGGKYSGYPAFNSPDTLVHSLKEAGFDILLTANNHSLDRGARGLKRTIEVLDRLQVPHLGTYASHEASDTSRVLILEKKGMRVALLNYTYGTNGIPVPRDVVVNLIDKKQIAADVGQARKTKPDAIVIFYHFGPEYARYPSASQKDLVRFSFEQGADAVIGSHPHVVQPFSIDKITDLEGVEKERLVVYSLGNFVSNQRNRYTNGGILFNFSLVRSKTAAGTTTEIRDTGYIPTWVHVGTLPSGKKTYRVLPAADFVDEKKSSNLNALAKKKIKEFYEDTVKHLQEDPKAVRQK